DEATVTVGESSNTTGPNGITNITLSEDEAGEYTALASKTNEGETSFNSDSVDVTVEAPTDIEVEDAYRLTTQAYTGDQVEVEAVVVNNGDRSGNATIDLTSNESDEVLD
ncbi:hypothetical protein, partial [Halorubrum ezzemoulense]|uniref:hypothetical protein n=1 Tax=Halorubrum ezzemoulense TaxID=337243 RepID=UPI00232C1191